MTPIVLKNVSVDFPVYGANSRSLKKSLLHGRITADAKRHIIVKALSDVTLEVAEGERVGIIGSNGAGKSTLLRTIAGIYEPSTGYVSIDGCITTLFSLNVGIEQDATGFENIILRGLAAGISRKEIDRHVAEIADFTELGDYLYLPLHTYSDGMRARLAFGISTAIEPDIILMDEWISAGDAAFLEKAHKRLESIISGARVLMLASHDERLLRRVCNRIVKLENGQVCCSGIPREMISL